MQVPLRKSRETPLLCCRYTRRMLKVALCTSPGEEAQGYERFQPRSLVRLARMIPMGSNARKDPAQYNSIPAILVEPGLDLTWTPG